MRYVLFSLVLTAWATFQPAAADKNSDLLVKVMAQIMTACTNEWGTDYRMVEYCRNRQLNAGREMTTIRDGQAKREPYLSVLTTCFDEWTDSIGTDAVMVVYCYNRQVEAYERLQRQ